MKDYSKMTKAELVARMEKQRKGNARYCREYRQRPENKEKAREQQKKYQRKLRRGYEAAKKAGLI